VRISLGRQRVREGEMQKSIEEEWKNRRVGARERGDRD